MHEFIITDDQRKRAFEISFPDQVFNQNKTGERAGMVGALGEIIVSDYLGVKPHAYKKDDGSVYDFDIDLFDIKLEVKTMNVYKAPTLDSDCCLTDYYDQKCDVYVFTAILNDQSKGWIEGWIRKKDFNKTEKFIPAGTVRERDGFTYKWNNHIVHVKDLNDIGRLKV
jgi:hypothetical protein